MTLKEMQQCEFIANIVMGYREKLHFLTSPCWMDEWALGYFCALRDVGIVNHEQWGFLCDVFQPEELNGEEAA